MSMKLQKQDPGFNKPKLFFGYLLLPARISLRSISLTMAQPDRLS